MADEDDFVEVEVVDNGDHVRAKGVDIQVPE
jgi:hypothetical protein